MKTKNAPEEIKELTQDQDNRLEDFYQKWLSIGLSIEPIDKNRAKKAIELCYKAGGLSKPKTIEFFDSPYSMLEAGAKAELFQEAIDSGKNEKDSEKSLTDKMIRERISSLISLSCFGQHDASWLSFYDFFNNELNLKEETKELIPMIKAAQELHWWLPFENACFVSQRPTVLKIEGEVLHCENGPAIAYKDGFSIYSLFGVIVPEWLACTPVKDLNANKIMAIENVDQRMAGIRKFGISRLAKDLKHKVIDKSGDYELWSIEIQGRRIGPYLKMVGPTTGDIHVEGVGALGTLDQNIKTCHQALAFRAGLKPEEMDSAPIFCA